MGEESSLFMVQLYFLLAVSALSLLPCCTVLYNRNMCLVFWTSFCVDLCFLLVFIWIYRVKTKEDGIFVRKPVFYDFYYKRALLIWTLAKLGWCAKFNPYCCGCSNDCNKNDKLTEPHSCAAYEFPQTVVEPPCHTVAVILQEVMPTAPIQTSFIPPPEYDECSELPSYSAAIAMT